MKTALYRHFDCDGCLLYVGISTNPFSRLTQHRNAAAWFSDVETIRVEWHPSRDAAISAEAAAVVSEKPLYNKMLAVSETGNLVTDLISQWPTRKALADEIGASNVAVHRWAKRNRIPSEWQQSVVEAAQARSIAINAAWMIAAHARVPE